MRPLAELDLGDEPRLDPDDVALADARHLRRLGERRVGRSSGRSSFSSRSISSLAEAGADVADPAQRAALVHGEHERAEARRAAALAARVAGDDELLAAVRLHLEPVARAAALAVRRVGPLGHHALEPLLAAPPRAAPRRRRSSPRAGPSAFRRSSSAASRARRSRERQRRRAARRRPRAGRTRSRRARPCPRCIAEKLGRPCSSSAQTSPSRTAFGVFTALTTAAATGAKRAGQVVAVPRDAAGTRRRGGSAIAR